MQQQDQLFQLIKSLTPHEKGYIRRMAGSYRAGDGNKYLRLFDAIDAQQEYDEGALRKKFAKEKFVRNFSTAKNYLLTAILRHLENYDSSPQREVHGLLSQYLVLRRKGLVALAYKLLRRAYQLCGRHELEYQRPEVLFYLLSHAITWGGDPGWPGGSKALLEEIREISALNADAADLRYQLQQVRRLTPGLMHSRTPEQTQQLLEHAQQLLRFDSSRLRSFDLRYQYYQLLTTCFFLANDMENGLKYSGMLCSWLEQNWSYMKTKASAYITAFYNKAMTELTLYRPSVRQTIGVLERMLADESTGNAASRVLLNRLQLGEALEMCRYEEVHQRAAFSLGFLQKHKAVVHYPAEAMICRMVNACAFFAEGALNAAAKELHAVLRDPYEPQAHAISSGARIMLLIVEYERGDRLTLESQVRSTYRYLLKKKQLHKVEKSVLDFLRVRARDRSEMLAALQKLQQQISEAIADKSEEPAVRVFDLQSYLESKISGIPFAEARRKRMSEKWRVPL